MFSLIEAVEKFARETPAAYLPMDVPVGGACSLGRLSLDTVNHVNKALKPLGKSLSITPCVSTTWDYRKPVAFEIHGTAYRINLYVSLWVM